MNTSSWMGLAVAVGCALMPCDVAEAQKLEEPEADAGAGDAAVSEADAGPQLLPPGTGVCLLGQGACDAEGACQGEATCAGGVCYAATAECESGAECAVGEFCIVFQAETCSEEVACADGQMCGDGQCFTIDFGTRDPAASEGDAGAADETVDETPAPTATSGDKGATEGKASEDGASDSSDSSSASACSIGAPSAASSSGVLGMLTLALGTLLQRRRRAR